MNHCDGRLPLCLFPDFFCFGSLVEYDEKFVHLLLDRAKFSGRRREAGALKQANHAPQPMRRRLKTIIATAAGVLLGRVASLHRHAHHAQMPLKLQRDRVALPFSIENRGNEPRRQRTSNQTDDYAGNHSVTHFFAHSLRSAPGPF